MNPLKIIFVLLSALNICLPAPVPHHLIKCDNTKKRMHTFRDETQEIISFNDDFYTLKTKEPIPESEIDETIQMIEASIKPIKLKTDVIINYKVQRWSVSSSRPFDTYEYLFYLVPTVSQKSLKKLVDQGKKKENGWIQFKTIVKYTKDVPIILHNVWYNQHLNQTGFNETEENDVMPTNFWTTEKLTTVRPATTAMESLPNSTVIDIDNDIDNTTTTEEPVITTYKISFRPPKYTTPLNEPFTFDPELFTTDFITTDLPSTEVFTNFDTTTLPDDFLTTLLNLALNATQDYTTTEYPDFTTTEESTSTTGFTSTQEQDTATSASSTIPNKFVTYELNITTTAVLNVKNQTNGNRSSKHIWTTENTTESLHGIERPWTTEAPVIENSQVTTTNPITTTERNWGTTFHNIKPYEHATTTLLALTTVINDEQL